MGEIGAIRTLCEALVLCLAAQDIEPIHRKSGMRLHLTLGYGECGFDPVALAWNGTPRDPMLIESHIGRHRVLQS